MNSTSTSPYVTINKLFAIDVNNYYVNFTVTSDCVKLVFSANKRRHSNLFDLEYIPSTLTQTQSLIVRAKCALSLSNFLQIKSYTTDGDLILYKTFPLQKSSIIDNFHLKYNVVSSTIDHFSFAYNIQTSPDFLDETFWVMLFDSNYNIVEDTFTPVFSSDYQIRTLSNNQLIVGNQYSLIAVDSSENILLAKTNHVTFPYRMMIPSLQIESIIPSIKTLNTLTVRLHPTAFNEIYSVTCTMSDKYTETKLIAKVDSETILQIPKTTKHSCSCRKITPNMFVSQKKSLPLEIRPLEFQFFLSKAIAGSTFTFTVKQSFNEQDSNFSFLFFDDENDQASPFIKTYYSSENYLKITSLSPEYGQYTFILLQNASNRLTLPTISEDTLVGRNTIDVLRNKTLIDASANEFTSERLVVDTITHGSDVNFVGITSQLQVEGKLSANGGLTVPSDAITDVEGILKVDSISVSNSSKTSVTFNNGVRAIGKVYAEGGLLVPNNASAEIDHVYLKTIEPNGRDNNGNELPILVNGSCSVENGLTVQSYLRNDTYQGLRVDYISAISGNDPVKIKSNVNILEDIDISQLLKVDTILPHTDLGGINIGTGNLTVSQGSLTISTGSQEITRGDLSVFGSVTCSTSEVSTVLQVDNIQSLTANQNIEVSSGVDIVGGKLTANNGISVPSGILTTNFLEVENSMKVDTININNADKITIGSDLKVNGQLSVSNLKVENASTADLSQSTLYFPVQTPSQPRTITPGITIIAPESSSSTVPFIIPESTNKQYHHIINPTINNFTLNITTGIGSESYTLRANSNYIIFKGDVITMNTGGVSPLSQTLPSSSGSGTSGSGTSGSGTSGSGTSGSGTSGSGTPGSGTSGSGTSGSGPQ
jgi:cytoskeletal protein CcmA (bactofilin family)